MIQQLDAMKKECDVIIFEKSYEYWEELDENIMSVSNYIFEEGLYQDNEKRDLLFQIVNDEHLLLPKDVGKLQVYYGVDCGSTNIITSNTKEKSMKLSDLKNLNGALSFKKSFNLPDWQTLEEDYSEIYTRFSALIKKEYPEMSKYKYYEKYDEHIFEVLGHELHYSFIGGYLNQANYIYQEERKDLQFVMQLSTDFSNGEIAYIFRKKSAPYNFEVHLAH